MKCTVPPDGWACTRDAGHGGPCAAVPTTQSSLTLEEFFLRNRARNVIDFHLRVDGVINDHPKFYIHAEGVDSDTLDFVVNGNNLMPAIYQ